LILIDWTFAVHTSKSEDFWKVFAGVMHRVESVPNRFSALDHRLRTFIHSAYDRDAQQVVLGIASSLGGHDAVRLVRELLDCTGPGISRMYDLTVLG
jgi:hypothetical protein